METSSQWPEKKTVQGGGTHGIGHVKHCTRDLRPGPGGCGVGVEQKGVSRGCGVKGSSPSRVVCISPALRTWQGGHGPPPRPSSRGLQSHCPR